MKNVFVWGCYWQGNFGDDLMAIMIADYLVSKGYQVKVFRLDHEISSKYGISTVENVEEGVSWADFVVLGGGAFLQGRISLKYKLLSASMRSIYKELVALKCSLDASKKPFSFCSIGSSGVRAYPELDEVVRGIFELDGLVGGSVRLPGDVGILRERFSSLNVKYFPDMLFSTYDFMAERFGYFRSSKRSERLRIGFNLSKRNLTAAKDLVGWCEENSSFVEPVFLLTHSEASGIRSEYKPRGSKILSVCSHDPLDFAQFISGLDLIVSVKLHLGLVGMSSGVEFFSFKGQEKTVAQLILLGAKENLVESDPKELLQKIELFCADARLGRKDVSALHNYAGSARKHLDFLNDFLISI